MSIAGIGGVNELPNLPGWDPRTGKTNIRRWKGPIALVFPETSSGTKAAELQAAGIKWSIESHENGQAIIRGEYGAEDQPEDVPLSDDWEEEPGWEQKSLWEFPAVQAVMDYIFPEEERAFAKQAFDALLRGDRKATNSAGEEIQIDLTGLLTAIATAVSLQGGDGNAAAQIMRQYFGERCKGTDSFRVEIHTVTRTRIVPLSTSIKPSRENVNKLFTPDGMASSEGFPGEAKAGFALHPGFYLKSHPKFERVSATKRRIIMTYEWCEYFSQFIYKDSPVA
jgi:hypothetical protein